MESVAWIYATCAGVVALFQLALAYGAPWGQWTLGGQYPGKLPLAVRFGAMIQSALLLAMAASVLHRAGVIESWPGWTFWPAMALTALTLIGNLITPSPRERRLWAPVTAAMLVSGLGVAFWG